MKLKSHGWWIVLVALASILGWEQFRTAQLSAQQPGAVVPNASDVRFEMMGNEPIAAPDNRALVSGWTVLMFRDRRANRCYVAFKNGDAIAVETADCARSPQ
jgi:hypothetical protein